MTRKGVPYSGKISQAFENDEGADISRYCSLGAPDKCCMNWYDMMTLRLL